MYQITHGVRFKRAIRKIARSGKYSLADIEAIIDLLTSGQELPKKYKNHFLSGDLSEYQECHIRADLLLIYRKSESLGVIALYDIGTHSALFGA